jgi:hypothetical protein
MYFIAVVVFGLWTVYATRQWKDWKTARYVTHPERRVWGPLRFFDDSEWTAEGLRLRRAYLRDIAIGLLLFFATLSVVWRVDHRSRPTTPAVGGDTNPLTVAAPEVVFLRPPVTRSQPQNHRSSRTAVMI